MAKRDFSSMVLGVVAALLLVLAYGMFVFLSAEAPGGVNEPTLAEIDEQLAEINQRSADAMAERDYLRASALKPPAGFTSPCANENWFRNAEEGEITVPLDKLLGLSNATGFLTSGPEYKIPSCRKLLEAWFATRQELKELKQARRDLELKLKKRQK